MTIARGLVLAVVLAACSGSHKESSITTRSITEVLAAHNDSLMALPGVVGTAVASCDGVPCIKVLLADSAGRSKIPDRLEGYRVVVEVTGPIRPR